MSSTAVAPTPQSTMGTEANAKSTGGPSSTSRQMRLKVSYTFDDTSSSNCLARWPHLVSTPVVQVDPDLLVGAVELKTCILSIISASPELVATLGQDYSVYAYDFSEAGFPLVGCGMLSWAMLNTQNSPTRIMVTGRVSCNTFAFFSNDAIKETLEVKFKLQKVETFTQEQFVRSVHTYTALARALPGEFDPSSWSNFIMQNPQVLTAQEKMPAIEALPAPAPAPPPPPPQYHQHTQPTHQPPPPPRQVQTAPAPPPVAWSDPVVSTSEDISQPPKKRQRTAPRPRAKAITSRKKSASAAPSPTELPLSSQPLPTIEEAHTPTGVPSPAGEVAPFVNQSLSRESSNIQRPLQIMSEPSPAMASSPPTQSEAGDAPTGVLSPAPTSPCLPALPDARIPDSLTNKPLETLVELPEPIADVSSNISRPVLPAPNSILRSNVNSFTTAPEGIASQYQPLSKKPSNPSSGMICPSSDIGFEPTHGGLDTSDRVIIKPKPIKPRTAKNVKERIETQLLEAIKRGEMPNYCLNCGAIETAVWRKVRLETNDDKDKERERASMEPHTKQEECEGSESAEKDKGKDDKDKGNEVLLCNACGLWYLSHKTMRPQNLWDIKAESSSSKSTNPRKRKKSIGVPTPPASSATHLSSEPATEPIVLQDEDATPRPTQPPQQQAVSTIKRIAMTPSARQSTSKDENREWNEAIAAGTRVARSSPVVGSADSPIDLDAEIDGAPSPRRLLFPSKHKKPQKSPLHHSTNKENHPPNREPSSSGSKSSTIPKTPTKKTNGSIQLRTPLRSGSRKLAGTVINMSPCRSSRRPSHNGPPATPERRLLKSQQQRMSLSPTANLLEKLLADDAETFASMDDTLAALPNITFDIDDSFLHTDLTMPSSPPPGFGLFQADDTDGAWSDFLPSTPGAFNMDDIFENDAATDGEMGSNKDGPQVDLSAFFDDTITTSGPGSVAEDSQSTVKDVPTPEATSTAVVMA